MKKILLMLSLALFSINAFAGNSETSVEIENLAEDSRVIEVLVEANAALDDLCDYFSGSWADTGLKIYCTFNKASAVCLAYKIVKVTCTINGAVRLSIEGDWNGAIKQSLIGATEVYVLSKTSSRSFELKPSRSYCPAY